MYNSATVNQGWCMAKTARGTKCLNGCNPDFAFCGIHSKYGAKYGLHQGKGPQTAFGAYRQAGEKDTDTWTCPAEGCGKSWPLTEAYCCEQQTV
jgi:hypothetical protein